MADARNSVLLPGVHPWLFQRYQSHCSPTHHYYQFRAIHYILDKIMNMSFQMFLSTEKDARKYERIKLKFFCTNLAISTPLGWTRLDKLKNRKSNILLYKILFE